MLIDHDYVQIISAKNKMSNIHLKIAVLVRDMLAFLERCRDIYSDHSIAQMKARDA